ncbi:Uncharacterised protein [Mycobacterium tuberculosis]|uniref:Uncharacterized protein n=2 Tax=Mycobacterium tuberculosis TaxID=1773 RepID=A0A916PFV9_MYCTX|nr:Uncharacterised protein [Mycobacterium tuberculosis]COW80249.1 Uncharacterised protein [Mycobacterium tuberculosis]
MVPGTCNWANWPARYLSAPAMPEVSTRRMAVLGDTNSTAVTTPSPVTSRAALSSTGYCSSIRQSEVTNVWQVRIFRAARSTSDSPSVRPIW